MKRIVLITLLSTAFQISCGSKRSKESNRNAKTEEAMGLIDVWKKQTIKSCNASDIAGARNDSNGFGLDMGLLFEQLGHSVVFVDGAGRTVQLTALPAALGSGTSKFESEVNINGNSRRVSLRTEYAGDDCSVYSGEQLLAKARIANRAEFRVLFDPALTGDALLIKSFNNRISKLNKAHYLSASQMLAIPEIFSSAEKFPSKDIAAVLGVGVDVAGNYLFASGQPALDSAVVEINDDTALTSFSAYQPEVYASSESSLTELIDGREFELRVKLAPNSFGDGYALNPKDKDLLILSYRLKFEPQTEALPNLRVLGFENGGRVQRSGELFKECVLRRNQILSLTVAPFSLFEAPRYENVVGACDELSSDAKVDLFAQKELREMVLSRFNFVTPSRRGYDGWEAPLQVLVMHCAREQSLVQNCLDSASGGVLLDSIDRYFESLKMRMPQSMELRSGRIELPASLALNWALTGQEVPDDRVELIAQSISNMVPELSIALPGYLEKVQSHAMSHDEIIQFAVSRDESYKAAFVKLSERASAAELYGAVASQWLEGAIVRLIGPDQFARAEVSIDAIVQFRRAELERAPADEFGQKSALADVERLALAELWTDQSFATASKISELAKFKITCREKKTVSLRIDCMGEQGFSNKTGKILAPEFAGRYGELAGDFSGYLEVLEKDFDSLRYDMDDAFGSDPIWARCDQPSFERNRSDLKTAMKTYFATESYKRYSQRDKVQEVLKRCS